MKDPHMLRVSILMHSQFVQSTAGPRGGTAPSSEGAKHGVQEPRAEVPQSLTQSDQHPESSAVTNVGLLLTNVHASKPYTLISSLTQTTSQPACRSSPRFVKRHGMDNRKQWTHHGHATVRAAIQAVESARADSRHISKSGFHAICPPLQTQASFAAVPLATFSQRCPIHPQFKCQADLPGSCNNFRHDSGGGGGTEY